MADEVNEQTVEQSPEAGIEPEVAPDVEQPAEMEQPAPAGPVPMQDNGPMPQQGATPAGPPEVTFSWQASEFVHHQKSVGWYATLAGAVLLLIVVAVIFHFWLEIGVFLVMGIAVFIYAQKPPRTMLYELSSAGIHIDGRVYPFADFRSFGVMPDEDWHSIDLEPSKRFNPRIVLLFDPQDLDDIVGHLEQRLPRVDRKPDTIERLTRYLRF